MHVSKDKHLIILVLAVIVIGLSSLFIGSVNVFKTNPDIVSRIIIDIRLPRMMLSFIVGVTLTMSGWVFQVLLRNPMADSFTLGLANAAILGSAVTVAIGLPLTIRPVMSVIFGLVSLIVVLGFTYSIDRHYRSDTLIISGILLGAIMSGLLYIIILMRPENLESIARYMFGSFSGASFNQVLILSIATLFALVVILRNSKALDLLNLGDIRAYSLGVRPKRLRPMLMIIASIPPLIAISYTGIIALIGIVIPQVILYIKPMRFKTVLVFSILYGGLSLIIVDTFGRTIIAPIQIPVAVMVLLFALPIMLFLLRSRIQSS